MTKKGVNLELIAEVKGIIYATEITEKGFTLVINRDTAKLEEYIGKVTKIDKATANVKFISIITTGHLVPQYALRFVTSVPLQQGFINVLNDLYDPYIRGWTPEEVKQFGDKLLSEGRKRNKDAISQFQQSLKPSLAGVSSLYLISNDVNENSNLKFLD